MIESFMAHFEWRYRFKRMGPAMRVLAMAAAHHRLNYIHPFPDGNGRVSRLMSHAMALSAGIGAHGLWSVSRGLARGLESRKEYKMRMDHADTPRQGDLDGRGNLSQKALVDFTLWFLNVCLDQVTFMAELFDLDNLDDRLARYVERCDSLRPEAARLLKEALIHGPVRPWRSVPHHRLARANRPARPRQCRRRRSACIGNAKGSRLLAFSGRCFGAAFPASLP